MASVQPYTNRSGEGPGPSSGGIARFITLAEQSSQGSSVKTGGITGSVVAGKGIKRKLDVKSYETKSEAIMAVEKGVKANCGRFWHSDFNCQHGLKRVMKLNKNILR
jgi:hypothetical protein